MEKRTLLWVLLIALTFRLGAVWYVQDRLHSVWKRDFVIAGDAEGYWELATNLATGKPYELYTPPRRVMRTPGFPLFLAAIIKFCDESHLAARIATALVGTATVGVVYLLGRELFDQTTGILAACLSAISPQAVGTSAMLLTETLFSLLIVVSLWLTAHWIKNSKTQDFTRQQANAALIGFTVAAAVYVRPTWLPASIVLGIMLALKSRTGRGILCGLMVPAICLISLLPWGMRNRNVTGHFVLTSLWMGPSLYDSFNPEADGSSNMEFFDREQVMQNRGLSEYEMNQHYRQRAIEFIKTEPQQAFSLALSHFSRYWSLLPNAEQFRSQTLVSWGLTGFTAVLFFGSLVGAYEHRRDLTLLVLTTGPILAFAAIHTIFVGSIRYRLPGEFPLSVLAAAGILVLWRRFCFTQGEPA